MQILKVDSIMNSESKKELKKKKGKKKTRNIFAF
jgi:hypothetical protein